MTPQPLGLCRAHRGESLAARCSLPQDSWQPGALGVLAITPEIRVGLGTLCSQESGRWCQLGPAASPSAASALPPPLRNAAPAAAVPGVGGVRGRAGRNRPAASPRGLHREPSGRCRASALRNHRLELLRSCFCFCMSYFLDSLCHSCPCPFPPPLPSPPHSSSFVSFRSVPPACREQPPEGTEVWDPQAGGQPAEEPVGAHLAAGRLGGSVQVHATTRRGRGAGGEQSQHRGAG